MADDGVLLKDDFSNSCKKATPISQDCDAYFNGHLLSLSQDGDNCTAIHMQHDEQSLTHPEENTLTASGVSTAVAPGDYNVMREDAFLHTDMCNTATEYVPNDNIMSENTSADHTNQDISLEKRKNDGAKVFKERDSTVFAPGEPSLMPAETHTSITDGPEKLSETNNSNEAESDKSDDPDKSYEMEQSADPEKSQLVKPVDPEQPNHPEKSDPGKCDELDKSLLNEPGKSDDPGKSAGDIDSYATANIDTDTASEKVACIQLASSQNDFSLLDTTTVDTDHAEDVLPLQCEEPVVGSDFSQMQAGEENTENGVTQVVPSSEASLCGSIFHETSQRLAKRFSRKSPATITINLCGQKLIQLYTRDDEILDEGNGANGGSSSQHLDRPRRSQTAVRGGSCGGRVRFREPPKTYLRPDHPDPTESASNLDASLTTISVHRNMHTERVSQLRSSDERFSEDAGLFADQPSTIICLKYKSRDCTSTLEESEFPDNRQKSPTRRIRRISAGDNNLTAFVNEDEESVAMSRGNKVSLVKATAKFKDAPQMLNDVTRKESPTVIQPATTKRSQHFSLVTVERPLSPPSVYDRPLEIYPANDHTLASINHARNDSIRTENVAAHSVAQRSSKLGYSGSVVYDEIRPTGKKSSASTTGTLTRAMPSSSVASNYAKKPSNLSGLTSALGQTAVKQSKKDPLTTERRLALQSFEVRNQIKRMEEEVGSTASRKAPRFRNATPSCKPNLEAVSRDAKETRGRHSGLKRKHPKSGLPSGPASFKRKLLMQNVGEGTKCFGPLSFKKLKLKAMAMRHGAATICQSFGLRYRQAGTSFVCPSHQSYCDGLQVFRFTADLPPKETILLDVRWDELEDLQPIGTEQLILWASTEEEIEELRSQVRREAEHHRTEHIMPLVMALTSDQIETTYGRVAEDMKSYDITEIDESDNDDARGDEEDDEGSIEDNDTEVAVDRIEKTAEPNSEALKSIRRRHAPFQNYGDSSNEEEEDGETGNKWLDITKSTSVKTSNDTEYNRQRPKRLAVDYGPSAFTPIMMMEGKRTVSKEKKSSSHREHWRDGKVNGQGESLLTSRSSGKGKTHEESTNSSRHRDRDESKKKSAKHEKSYKSSSSKSSDNIKSRDNSSHSKGGLSMPKLDSYHKGDHDSSHKRGSDSSKSKDKLSTSHSSKSNRNRDSVDKPKAATSDRYHSSHSSKRSDSTHEHEARESKSKHEHSKRDSSGLLHRHNSSQSNKSESTNRSRTFSGKMAALSKISAIQTKHLLKEHTKSSTADQQRAVAPVRYNNFSVMQIMSGAGSFVKNKNKKKVAVNDEPKIQATRSAIKGQRNATNGSSKAANSQTLKKGVKDVHHKHKEDARGNEKNLEMLQKFNHSSAGDGSKEVKRSFADKNVFDEHFLWDNRQDRGTNGLEEDVLENEVRLDDSSKSQIIYLKEPCDKMASASPLQNVVSHVDHDDLEAKNKTNEGSPQTTGNESSDSQHDNDDIGENEEEESRVGDSFDTPCDDQVSPVFVNPFGNESSASTLVYRRPRQKEAGQNHTDQSVGFTTLDGDADSSAAADLGQA